MLSRRVLGPRLPLPRSAGSQAGHRSPVPTLRLPRALSSGVDVGADFLTFAWPAEGVGDTVLTAHG